MARNRLGKTLSDTRDALLQGDVTRLADLAAEIEKALQKMPRDASSLLGIRQQACANIPLLLAALLGVSEARQLLGRAISHHTYDADGMRQELATGLNQTDRIL